MTRYTEELTDEELATVEVERWQPVASSSQPHNFVPAGNQMPQLPQTFWQPPSGNNPVFTPTNAVDERTSAQDRAWGYNIRLIPIFVLSVILALCGMIAFIVTMRWTETQVDGLLYILVFLSCLGLSSGIAALYISRQDYRNSSSGVELERIAAVAQIEMQREENNHELRRRALDGYLGRLQIGASSD